MLPFIRPSWFPLWRFSANARHAGVRKPSLRRQLLIALGLALVLLISAIISAGYMTEQSRGEAGLLNQTASLRMMLWRIEATRQAGQSTALLVKTYDDQLHHLSDLAQSGQLPRGDLTEPLLQTWQRLGPQLELVSHGENPKDLNVALNNLTVQIDAVVTAIQNNMETQTTNLRWFQGGILAATFLLMLGIIRHLQRDFFAPLTTLQKAAHAVRNGQFSVRVPLHPANELGDLGAAFNTMVERLAILYSGLEHQVAEQTQELQQSHHLLQLLYRTATRLAEQDLTQEVLLEMLVDVERELGLGPGIVCVRRPEDGRAYPLATPLPEEERAALCEALGCNICFGTGTPSGISEHQVGALRLVSIPLTGGGQWQGVMPFQIKPGHSLLPWQTRILQTLAGHVATALANARRTEERHRLAVYEERAIIARELHDSLAQSLSYLKIQVSLLQSRLDPQLSPELHSTVAELKMGLNSAYRELRELLTTFRLSPGQTPFTEELDVMVKDASRRCGFEILLAQRMNGLELSAHEEIHLSRLIREALINLERHAQADWAEVVLEANSLRQVELRIEDNGIGWPADFPKEGHYGLQILRERSALLKGSLTLDQGMQGGARLTLQFIAQTPYLPH